MTYSVGYQENGDPSCRKMEALVGSLSSLFAKTRKFGTSTRGHEL